MNKKNLEYRYFSIFGAVAIMLAASLWALDGLLIRPNLYKIDVVIVVFLEHLIAFLILTPFCLRFVKGISNLKIGDWLAFVLVGLFGGAIGTIAITKSFFVVFHDGANISVILLLQKLQPVFAIGLAFILLKERPKKDFFLWALIAMIGSYILTFGFSLPDLSFSNKTNIAAGLSILAAACFGASTVFSKRAVTNVSFYMGTYIRFGMTTIITFMIVVFFSRFGSFSQVSSGSLGLLFIIALTTGSGAMFLYYFGLKRINASSSTIYELAFPVTSVVGEWLIYGKFMGMIRLLGAIILVVAMTMMVLEKNKYGQLKKK